MLDFTRRPGMINGHCAAHVKRAAPEGAALFMIIRS